MTASSAFPLRFVPLLFLLAPVYAQINPFACQGSVPVVPVINRQGGPAQVGDFFLDCTGGSPIPSGLPVPQVDFTLFLNMSIDSSFVPVLSVDSPGTPANPNVLLCSDPLTGCMMDGALPGSEPYDGSPGRANEFQGVSTCSNCMVFYGIPIDPPGPSGNLLIQFGNVYIDPLFAPDTVMTDIAVTSSTSITINGPQQTSAIVTPEPSIPWLIGFGLVTIALRKRSLSIRG